MGYKPIAVMVEDIDENGVIRSSIPVQFLAEVDALVIIVSASVESHDSTDN